MQASLTFRCADSTELINNIAANILPAGVYIFPGFDTTKIPNELPIANNWILPSILNTNTGFQVTIKGPWIVRNVDGMTIREALGTDHAIDLPGVGSYYVGLFARYLVHPDPILELRYITLADYENWSEKQYFIIFAKVVIPSGSTNVTSQMIDFDARQRPRGVLFLTEDAFTAGSTIRVASDYSNMPLNPRPRELVYVRSENALYFNDVASGVISNWIRVDNPMKGITTLNPPSGRGVNLPLIARNRDYHVNISLIQNTGGNAGEIWIERRATDFIIHNTGIATTQIMWNVVV